MEFTHEFQGDRAIVSPRRTLLAGHVGKGSWVIRTLPDLQELCTVNSGSSLAEPVFHPSLPRLLLWSRKAVMIYCFDLDLHLGGEGANYKRNPNAPDGLIKEVVDIESVFFLPDHEHIVTVLANRNGIRVWSWNRRHEPVLSVSSRLVFSNEQFMGLIVNSSVYVLRIKDWTVVGKYKVPPCVLTNGLFLAKRHSIGEYGIVLWQAEEQVHISFLFLSTRHTPQCIVPTLPFTEGAVSIDRTGRQHSGHRKGHLHGRSDCIFRPDGLVCPVQCADEDLDQPGPRRL